MQAEALLICATDTETDKDYLHLYLSFDNAMRAWKDLNTHNNVQVSGIKPVTIMDFEEFFDDKEEMVKMYGDTAEIIRFTK